MLPCSKVLYFDPVVSCLRSGIAQVLQTLPPESLVLVYIAGHGVQTESHTLIVPEDAEDWSGSLSLEHEFASQIVSWQNRERACEASMIPSAGNLTQISGARLRKSGEHRI